MRNTSTSIPTETEVVRRIRVMTGIVAIPPAVFLLLAVAQSQFPSEILDSAEKLLLPLGVVCLVAAVHFARRWRNDPPHPTDPSLHAR
jgi:hypothetical protein